MGVQVGNKRGKRQAKLLIQFKNKSDLILLYIIFIDRNYTAPELIENLHGFPSQSG